jgi:hypothetical protein
VNLLQSSGPNKGKPRESRAAPLLKIVDFPERARAMACIANGWTLMGFACAIAHARVCE